ncbi:hypothetical protein JOM56_000606 [Amanita muscaria]
MSLPLEFRGSDPNLRRNMETVIEGLMDSPSQRVNEGSEEGSRADLSAANSEMAEIHPVLAP